MLRIAPPTADDDGLYLPMYVAVSPLACLPMWQQAIKFVLALFYNRLTELEDPVFLSLRLEALFLNAMRGVMCFGVHCCVHTSPSATRRGCARVWMRTHVGWKMTSFS